MKMKRISKMAIVIMASAVVLQGCSHETWVQTEETTRVAGFGTSLLLPVNLIAKAGRAISSSNDQPTSDTVRAKQILMSKALQNDFSNDGDVMSAVLEIQDKIQTGDFGISGHFPIKGKTVLAVDHKGYFTMRYADEAEPKP